MSTALPHAVHDAHAHHQDDRVVHEPRLLAGHEQHSTQQQAAGQMAHSAGGHMMKMWFHGGCEEVVLFEWWRIDSWSGLAASCFIIFFMSFFYEYVKWFRVYLELYAKAKRRPDQNVEECNCLAPMQVADDVLMGKAADGSKGAETSNVCKLLNRFVVQSKVPARLVQSALYLLQLDLAYWLMLIAMTYNVYLTAAVVLGATVGHWTFVLGRRTPACAQQSDEFAADACH